MRKFAKWLVCQNPKCYTHRLRKQGASIPNYAFTISTAVQDKIFCSLTCENEDAGIPTTLPRRK